VFEEQGRICGLLVLRRYWVEQLYVHPQRTGQGPGSRLIERPQVTRSPLQPGTIRSNLGARSSCERYGIPPGTVHGRRRRRRVPRRATVRPAGCLLSPAEGHSGGTYLYPTHSSIEV
jgi:GNAT superfamily N-acetyltransferase